MSQIASTDTITPAAQVKTGDLITYVGAFAHYRVLSDPQPCSQIPGRVVFEARNETSERRHTLRIRLKAEEPVELIEYICDLGLDQKSG